MITLKAGVVLDRIAPAGYLILDAGRETAARLQLTLRVTCGNEAHPPEDPHTKGEAIDFGCKEFPIDQKRQILQTLMRVIGEWEHETVMELGTPDQLATGQFFGQLELLGQPGEHLHIQRRRGRTYTIADFLA